MLYIGLMSGTSANGIDAALVEFNDKTCHLVAARSRGYSNGIKESIESVIQRYPEVDEEEIRRLDRDLGVDFADAAAVLIDEARSRGGVEAIGSHGQTVYHGPADTPPVTVQLGDPQVIADRTGVTTVGDFRRNDLLEGGQGAPLAPAFHNALFRDVSTDRLILNLGGIANLTWLPADPELPVLGFDTGPANTLMDQWCEVNRSEPYDEEGRWAAQGQAAQAFVEALLADPYFDAPAPKSTGREYFNLGWMKSRYPGWRDEAPVDIQAGLLEVTARSVASAAARIGGDSPHELYVCGGGARNKALIRRLGELTASAVATTDALGVPPDWVEGCAFAWLARRRLKGLPGNLPSVTGARRAVMLGEIHAPDGTRRPDPS